MAFCHQANVLYLNNTICIDEECTRVVSVAVELLNLGARIQQNIKSQSQLVSKVCNDAKLWARLAGREYREPKPLDMSPEAVQKRRDRALRSARKRAANRD